MLEKDDDELNIIVVIMVFTSKVRIKRTYYQVIAKRKTFDRYKSDKDNQQLDYLKEID